MLEFTWKIFCLTGNIETYLLLKELEKYEQRFHDESENCVTETFDSTVH